MVIDTENGAKTLGKPKGTYVTIEAPNLNAEGEDYHSEIAYRLADIVGGMMRFKKEDASILVVGLGNRMVTPDSLGPAVADHMMITRHIVKEFGSYAFGRDKVKSVSAIVPGVMAQTGMESVEIVKGIIRETKPDHIVAVDALAARNTKRLMRTIQVSDSGITPGSGVGNHRHGLNEKTLGVPVIALGVPTVVDAETIVNDAVNDISDNTEGGRIYRNLNMMFVTPKDIDESINRLASTISDALNLAFG
jgi:spore protease